jgi:hypothetical protein
MLRKSLIPYALTILGAGAALPALGQPLDGTEDFAQIARRGFAEVVAGSYPAPVDGEFPALSANALGSPSNSYPWGMAWFNPAPSLTAPFLWVGTVRNLLCFLAPGSSEECPEPTDDGIPLPRFPEEAAEIWRYNPGTAPGGIDGTWIRAWQSSQVPFPLSCAFGLAGTGATEFEEILELLEACYLAGPSEAPALPQHIGIRSLEVCGANGDGPNVDRLYASNLGLPARVIRWDNATATFVDASYTGDTFVLEELADLNILDYDLNDPEDVAALIALFTGVAAELPQMDLGYRTLSCWDKPLPGGGTDTVLCTAPAGSFQDTDSSFHPWVICNEDPSDLESPWEAHSPFGFGEPEEIGIFDMAVVHVEPEGGGAAPESEEPVQGAPADAVQHLCASGFDRVNGGSIWCTDGTGCDVDVAPADGVQDCVWTKMIADAMGRPSFDPVLGALSGPSSNPAAFGMGTFDEDGDGYDDYLYYGMAEAAGGGFAGNALAEMGRIDFREEIEVTGPEQQGPEILAPNPNFLKWEFVAGLPRILVASGGEFVVPANMNCNLGLLFGFYQACLPVANRGLGFATSAFGFGPASYFWRFEQHEGSLYVGSLDLLGSFLGDASGFNLWRSEDGVNFTTVTNDGFGWGVTNYGVRGLLSTDPTPGVDNTPGAAGPLTGAPEPEAAIGAPVLFLGAANPFGLESEDGGAQVWLGSTLPNYGPAALAGPDQTVYDDENCDPVFPDDCLPGDGMVTLALDGSASYDWFGGSITGHEWFTGTGTCGTLAGPFAATSVAAPTVAAGDGVGTPFIDYTYTLRVTDNTTPTGLQGCDTVTVRASSNLPPFAIFETDPPFNASNRVQLVDFDGDGRASFQIKARCLDPEGNLGACTWQALGSGVDLSPERDITDPVTTPFTGTYVGGATALLEDDADALYGDPTPTLSLLATDVVGVTGAGTIDVSVLPVVDTAADDAPVCGSGTVITLKDTPVVFDPDDPAPGEARFCIDPDGEALIFEGVSNTSSGIAQGFLAGSAAASGGGTTITYTPGLDEVGRDRFTFRADDAGVDSNTVTAHVRVIDCIHSAVYNVIDLATLDAPADQVACIGILATNSTVQTGPITFTAGEWVALGNGFTVLSGQDLTLDLDPAFFTE